MKVHKRSPILLWLILAAITTGCANGTSNPIATPSPKPDATQTTVALATPYAQQPAAGICASTDGESVVITLNPELPDPRCSKVLANQKLTVINNTQSDLLVAIGSFEENLAPGGRFTIDKPFGEYLAPGVHQLTVTPCCGAEIWLEEK